MTYIAGAGGIGAALGYGLLAAGVRVVFVENDDAKIERIRSHGIAVDDRPSQKAEVVHVRGWQPAADARVLLCVKCYDNAAVLERLPPTVTLVPIQNGFDARLDAFGHGAEGIASFVAKCGFGSTRVAITRPGDLHLGLRGPDTSANLAELAAQLAVARLFRVVVVPDILPIKHAKLMYNAAISPLAAAAGIDNGQLLSDPDARRLFFALLQENYRILVGAGIELGTIGPFHPRTVMRILSTPWIARVMARSFERSLRGTYCSMAGEIETGRTEIANYTGHLLHLANGRTASPLNDAVYELVTRMQRERATPRREVIAGLCQHLP